MVPVLSFRMFSATGFVELSNSENSTSSPTFNSTASPSLKLTDIVCLTHDGNIEYRVIIGSDRRPETQQGIEGKIVRFRSGRVRVKDKDR